MIRHAFVLGLVALAAAPSAQQPAMENAKLETRAFSGSLASQFAQFGAGPLWAGYLEPAVAGNHGDMRWSDDSYRSTANGVPVRC